MSGERLVIEFEPPAPLLNANDRLSPFRRADLVRAWRHTSYFYACQAVPGGPEMRSRRLRGRQRISVTLPVRGRRRRDCGPNRSHTGTTQLADQCGLTGG